MDVARRVRDSGTTVVLVTHDVEEAERLCDRIVVLDHGRVVAEGTPGSIVRDFGAPVTVSFTDADIDEHTLRRLPGVDDVVRDGEAVRAIGSGPVLVHVGAHLVALGRPALDLRVQLPTLEECFVALTHAPVEEASK